MLTTCRRRIWPTVKRNRKNNVPIFFKLSMFRRQQLPRHIIRHVPNCCAVSTMFWLFSAAHIVCIIQIKAGVALRRRQQEAQLPQRNSASAAHMEGAKPSSPAPPPLWLHLCVRSNPKPATICTSSVPSVKRTLS